MHSSAVWNQARGGHARRPSNPLRVSTAVDRRAAVTEQAAARAVALAFASLHKRAFGVAIGTAGALAILAVTLADVAFDATRRFPLGLLSNYFHGYDVTVPGALIGAAWLFAVGFVGGWFVAFTRNLVLTLWLVVVRAKMHFAQGQNLLDHL